MFRLALRSVRHNPKRLILTALAVALGVSLVTTTYTLTNSFSNGFDDLFEGFFSETDVVVQEDPDAAAENAEAEDDFGIPQAGIFTEADLAAVAATDGVDIAHPAISFATWLLPAEGVELDTGAPADSPFGALGPPSTPLIWSGDTRIDGTILTDGAAPEAADEVALGADTASEYGYAIGDTVRISGADGTSEFTLVGLAEPVESNDFGPSTTVYFSTASAFAASGWDTYTSIDILVSDGSTPDDVAAALADVVPEGARAITSQELAAETTEAIGDFLNYINIFTIAFALVSLFVGAYIIVNTFRVIVTQRTREFGLMRAIGVTGNQVRNQVLLEAVFVGIVGTTVGILAGYLLALIVGGIAAFVYPDVIGALLVPGEAVLWSYVMGIGITIVAALMPAIHASRISPMEALREAGTGGKKPLRLRNVIGAALTALGIFTITVGLYAGLVGPYWYVAAGAVMLVLGVTLLAAQGLVPLAIAARGLLTRWFGVDGKLSANNIQREPRRSANTAAALMIGVMLLSLVATFTQSLRSTVESQFEQIEADFFAFYGAGNLPQPALDIIAGADEVDVVSRFALDQAQVDGEQWQLTAIDAATLEQTMGLDTDHPVAEIDGGVFLGPALVEAGYDVGDSIVIEGSAGTETFEVTGLYNVEEDGDIFMDWPDAQRVLGEDLLPLQANILLADGVELDEGRDAINELLADEYPLVLLQEPSAFEQLINFVVDLIMAIITALLSGALVIAVLGVANTLLLSVTERTREIGLLRAVGMSRSSVWRMVTVESVVMAVFGTILGIVLGVGLGAALVISLEEYGFTGVSMPWSLLGIYTGLALVAGVVAAIWPAWRASRLDILKAIAADG